MKMWVSFGCGPEKVGIVRVEKVVTTFSPSTWVENDKSLLHTNRWDVYISDKLSLTKGVYSVELSGYDEKKVLWKVVDNHVI